MPRTPRPSQASYQPRKRGSAATSEIDYTDDERTFMLAMERHKKETGHRFPTWSEVLGVLRSLGYSKPTEGGA